MPVSWREYQYELVLEERATNPSARFDHEIRFRRFLLPVFLGTCLLQDRLRQPEGR